VALAAWKLLTAARQARPFCVQAVFSKALGKKVGNLGIGFVRRRTVFCTTIHRFSGQDVAARRRTLRVRQRSVGCLMA